MTAYVNLNISGFDFYVNQSDLDLLPTTYGAIPLFAYSFCVNRTWLIFSLQLARIVSRRFGVGW